MPDAKVCGTSNDKDPALFLFSIIHSSRDPRTSKIFMNKDFLLYSNDPNFDTTQVIHQYIKLEYFFKLLETGCYHINKKKTFEDKNESELPISCMFRLHWVGENAPKITKTQIKKETALYRRLQKEYKRTQDWLTSCWTKESHENVLKWQNYTQTFGVRVGSTVEELMKSLKDCSFNIISRDISYGPYIQHPNVEDYLFKKDRYFKDEEEVRFYFLPKKKLKIRDNGINIEIDFHQMIDSVTISPYIHPILAKLLISYLKKEYDIKALQSKIKYNI